MAFAMATGIQVKGRARIIKTLFWAVIQIWSDIIDIERESGAF